MLPSYPLRSNSLASYPTLLGIPFKRLLGCGLGAGGLMTGIKPIFPDWSVLIGAVSLLLLLIFTQPRQGIPRWRQVWYSTRWRIISTAALAPEGLVGQFASLLHLPVDGLTIDAATLFTPMEEAAPRTELHLIQSGVPYTIVRPGGLLNTSATNQVKAGYRGINGQISREDVAMVLVQATIQPGAKNKILEIVHEPGAGSATRSDLFSNGVNG